MAKVATKTTFRNGKTREALAGLSASSELHPVLVGAVTMDLGIVAEFLPSGSSPDPIDLFVWDGDMYVSRQSDRVLFLT